MRELSITTPKGVLSAVLHEASGANHLLIVCHGFRGSKDNGGRSIVLSDLVVANGFSVLRFDFTPQATLSRQIEDLGYVVEFCREIIGGSIILLGRSMGGSAALAFAARDQGIAGICLWATPWNLAETFQLSLGEKYQQLVLGESVTVEDEYGRVRLTPQFIEDFTRYDLLFCARSLGRIPLLILHGEQDGIVPLAQAHDLFLAASGPKKMVVIPEDDHQFTYKYDETTRELLNWLRETFV